RKVEIVSCVGDGEGFVLGEATDLLGAHDMGEPGAEDSRTDWHAQQGDAPAEGTCGGMNEIGEREGRGAGQVVCLLLCRWGIEGGDDGVGQVVDVDRLPQG